MKSQKILFTNVLGEAEEFWCCLSLDKQANIALSVSVHLAGVKGHTDRQSKTQNNGIQISVRKEMDDALESGPVMNLHLE